MSTKTYLSEVCSYKIVGKGWNKVYKTYQCLAHIITKECGHNMMDNKWESTHVYQDHLVKKSRENSKKLVESYSISTRLILPQQ